MRKGFAPTTAQTLDGYWGGGGSGEALPISDVNFDKYLCCLSLHVLDKKEYRKVFFSKHKYIACSPGQCYF